MRLAFTILLFLCSPLYASDYPARYSVTGVAANDTLNIRAAPEASAEKLDAYPPYAINIEILRTTEDGKWGMVGLGEGNGWVAMRFLSATPNMDPYSIPRPLTCSGAEPFWGLALHPRGSEFSELGFEAQRLSDLSEAVTSNAYLATFELGPTLTYTLISERTECGDGMSDRAFGFSARLFIQAPDGNRYLRGCCTMDHSR